MSSPPQPSPALLQLFNSFIVASGSQFTNHPYVALFSNIPTEFPAISTNSDLDYSTSFERLFEQAGQDGPGVHEFDEDGSITTAGAQEMMSRDLPTQQGGISALVAFPDSTCGWQDGRMAFGLRVWVFSGDLTVESVTVKVFDELQNPEDIVR